MTAKTADVLTRESVDQAIAVAEDNRRNHENWLRWREAGKTDSPLAGDADHHREALDEYTHLLRVLRAIRRRIDDRGARAPSPPDPAVGAVTRLTLLRSVMRGIAGDSSVSTIEAARAIALRALSEDEDLARDAAASDKREALDVPPEAIEWARQLVEQGYRDEHIVTFSESGYGLEHPILCRPDLIGCWFNRYLAGLGYPDEEPGRYLMTRHKGHAEYARLAPEPQPREPNPRPRPAIPASEDRKPWPPSRPSPTRVTS